MVKRSGNVTRLQALVDKKRIVITEDIVCEILQLNDAEGVICLLNEEIFAGLARMGYEKPSTKLTFYKAFFSTQWKFFIHTILHSLSAKRTSWNEFSSAMASTLICLSSGQRFNFSKYIFESLVRNVDSSSKFDMYPRFIQLIIQTNIADLSKHTTRYISPVLTQKVFANMRRVGKGFSGVETPLFENMLAVRDVDKEVKAQVHAQGDDVQELAVEEVATDLVPPTPTSPSPSSHVIPSLPPHQPRSRVKKLEKINKVKSSKLRRLKKVGTSQRVESSDDVENVFNQGRMIVDMDQDEGIELVTDQEKDAELLELMLLKRSKENTKCVSAAGEELTAAKHKLELKLFRDAAAAHMNAARLSKFLLSGKCYCCLVVAFVLFSNTAVVKRSGDVTRLQALVDKKKIVISKDVIREILRLDDAESVVCLPNEEIFTGLAQMRYEKPSTKLTFYKAFFSSQCKFLIHTILQSLSASRVGKGFSGVETPLFKNMLEVREVDAEEEVQAPAQDDVDQENVTEEIADDVAQPTSPIPPLLLYHLYLLTNHPDHLHHKLQKTANTAQQLEILKLKARVKKLERLNKVKSSKLRRLKKVGTSQCIESSEDLENVFNQERINVVAASTHIPAAKPAVVDVSTPISAA
nr:hypothetical protein [Tanacetum cinerariifolium]